jgi:ABC-type transport system involved in multi-copper enzyme maturation permease subunit
MTAVTEILPGEADAPALASVAVAPGARRRRRSPRSGSRTWTVARTDLRQLYQSPDFWVPMVVLASFFFIISPAVLLWAITHIKSNGLVSRVGATLSVLPGGARTAINHRAPNASPAVKASYALAVYLFAPLAVIVPMMISTAVGANCLVGEREKGTGEWLSHCPATERELYTGKLIASLIPGYLTTLVGFGVYSLVVNLIVGPHVGGWFFPTEQWWVLMFWIVPPFLAVTLSVVLRLSARVKSAAAAQQASGLVTLPAIMLSYAESSGQLFGHALGGLWIGAVVWCIAGLGLWRGARAVTRARLLGVDGDLS